MNPYNATCPHTGRTAGAPAAAAGAGWARTVVITAAFPQPSRTNSTQPPAGKPSPAPRTSTWRPRFDPESSPGRPAEAPATTAYRKRSPPSAAGSQSPPGWPAPGAPLLVATGRKTAQPAGRLAGLYHKAPLRGGSTGPHRDP